MSLAERINEDMKQAMRARDQRKLEALRAIKAGLLLIKTGKDVGSGEIPEEVEIQLLQKLVKQRRESAEIYKTQARTDLLEEELYQAGVIEAYLPAQLSDEDLKEGLAAIIARTGASTVADMGKVMAAATAEFAGKADNKRIAGLVRQLLGA
ncbi:MAG: GatB/YqeY domain-containing protein [Lentimicrobiaceae bacterium]|nr:GatB/YqeY domain-containing protein [Lentimicrobiaceae bacterium]